MGHNVWIRLIAVAAAVVFGCTAAVEEASANAEYYDAEMLVVVWEADPAAIKPLLPPPLEPYEKPLVVAFVADFPRTNFGVVYKMATLSIFCTFNGELGSYCVSMPENDDMAVFGGREGLGLPKKVATLDFVKAGESVSGWAERRGIRFFEIAATANHKPDFGEHEPIMHTLFPNLETADAVGFMIKGSSKVDRTGFDYPPQLIRQVTQFRPYLTERCDAEVTVRPSPYEPWWSMLKPTRVLGAMYLKSNNEMLPGSIVGTVTPQAFLQDMGYSWDFPR